MKFFKWNLGKPQAQASLVLNEETVAYHLSDNVTFFPGSQEEYERKMGYVVKVIDTGTRDQGVGFRHIKMLWPDSKYEYDCFLPFEVKKMLVEEGIEAIINCRPVIDAAHPSWVPTPQSYYGLPVARKR